jgi:hypothetical protein
VLIEVLVLCGIIKMNFQVMRGITIGISKEASVKIKIDSWDDIVD